MLPVFRWGSTGEFLLQCPDVRSEKIQAFSPLEHLPHGELTELSAKRHVRVGDRLIYGFQCGPGRLLMGALDELRQSLEEFALSSNDIATKLQIAELVGTPPQKREMRRRMTQLVETSSGENASDIFSHTSVFLQALWDRLVNKIADGEKLKILADHKKRLLLEADPRLEGVFPLNVQEWLTGELGIVSSQIAREIREELPFALDELSPHQDIKPDILRERIFGDLSEIGSEPRQEARIARLVRRVMENPGLGKHLVQQFSDRAEFARKAAKLISANIANFDLSPSPQFIEWFVDELYTLAYPRQRGVLLYELANHLGEFPVFAEPILARARHSNSEAVRFARDAVEERISNPNAPRRPVHPPRVPYHYSYVPRPREPFET